MPLSTFTSRDDFERLLRMLATDSQGGSFGRLHILSVKPMLKDSDWQKVLPKAAAIAEQILQHRLTRSDSCLALAAGQYLLLFPSLSESEGQVRASAIAREIKRHLTGTDSENLDVATEVAPLALLRQLKTPPTVDSVRVALEAAPVARGIQLSVEWQGVWHSADQKLFGSRARLRRDFGMQVIHEGRALFGGDDDSLAVEANTVLARGGAAFPPDHGALFLPIFLNAHTLGAPRGFVPVLDTIGQAGNPNIVIELGGAVASLGRPVLRSVIEAIRARRHRVALRMVAERETAKFLHDCGAEFLCLNQSEARHGGFTPSALYALYTMIAHDVGDLGFRLCLWNADTAEDVKRAHSLGFHIFSGSPVGPTAPSPPLPHGLAARQIFA